MQTVQDLKDPSQLKKEILQYLHAHGRMEVIKASVRQELVNQGWKNSIQSRIQDKINSIGLEKCCLDDLFDEVQPIAQYEFPGELRAQILLAILNALTDANTNTNTHRSDSLSSSWQ